ncbi:hypothetical protein MRX96_042976 [Rhipicephalus microplus]
MRLFCSEYGNERRIEAQWSEKRCTYRDEKMRCPSDVRGKKGLSQAMEIVVLERIYRYGARRYRRHVVLPASDRGGRIVLFVLPSFKHEAYVYRVPALALRYGCREATS